MRLICLLLYLVILSVMVGLLFVFLTGGLPHRTAGGVFAPAPSMQPGNGPARSMEDDIRQQEEMMRDFLESVPSPTTTAP